MLNDDEIERAESKLAEYRRCDALSKILDQYTVLLEDYKRLKSDYEEERDAREKYKQMARGQERNPFALVLVDGDGYVFHESLVEQGAEGGRIAAQRLDQTVKASLRRKGLESCQVMVRIYANVAGLSKAIYKAGGGTGPEKRSLCPFIAGFNRSFGLAEFVDAGELKENADFKLRSLLHLYAENSQCKHIYFAACHDAGYISDLTPHMGNSRKFSLLGSPGTAFHDEFSKLGLGLEELPGVFRTTPLDSATRARQQSSWRSPAAPSPISSAVLPTTTTTTTTTTAVAAKETNGQQKYSICRFYMQGKCRFGKDCNNIHPKDKPSNGSKNPASWGGGGSETWGLGLEISSIHIAPDINRSKLDIQNLPDPEDIPDGQVAVNSRSHRLDAYIPPVSAKVVSQLKSLIGNGTRLCNGYQLNGSCENGSLCRYSHDPLGADLKLALEALARAMPCPKRGGCRNDKCTSGHVCQNPDCKHRGGNAYCKLPYATHSEELVAANFVQAVPKVKQASLDETQASPPPARDGDDDDDDDNNGVYYDDDYYGNDHHNDDYGSSSSSSAADQDVNDSGAPALCTPPLLH